jgi:hypothetical protein
VIAGTLLRRKYELPTGKQSSLEPPRPFLPAPLKPIFLEMPYTVRNLPSELSVQLYSRRNSTNPAFGDPYSEGRHRSRLAASECKHVAIEVAVKPLIWRV